VIMTVTSYIDGGVGNPGKKTSRVTLCVVISEETLVANTLSFIS